MPRSATLRGCETEMSELLTTAQLAKILQLAEVTLATWRTHNKRLDARAAAGEKVTEARRGPPFITVGERGIRYDRAAVQAWLDSRANKRP